MSALLKVEGVSAGYRDTVIIDDVFLTANAEEIVAVIGPNGAGKSTLVKVIAGLLPPRRGSVEFMGQEVTGAPAEVMVRRGLVYVPQVDNAFPSLTVAENLELMFPRRTPKLYISGGLEEVVAMFPQLRDRLRSRVGMLSGGERQMVALARAVVTSPKLIILDEPSAGLSPALATMILDKLQALRGAGRAVLLVEQNAKKALEVADRAYVLESGRNVTSGNASEMLADPKIHHLYLGASLEGNGPDAGRQAEKP